MRVGYSDPIILYG